MSQGSGSTELDQLIDIGANYFSLGTIGFGKEGFKEGISVKGLKEVTGAAAAEEANEMARKQFEEQKTAAQRDRENALAANAAQQLQLSRTAGSSRKPSTTSNKPSNNLLGGAERDFLGL